MTIDETLERAIALLKQNIDGALAAEEKLTKLVYIELHNAQAILSHIETLRKENTWLREALEPFSKLAGECEGCESTHTTLDIPIAALFKARTALAAK